MPWLLLIACSTKEPSPPGDTEAALTCEEQPVPPCVNPQPILNKDGSPTGYEECENGDVNRAEQGTMDANFAPLCEEVRADEVPEFRDCHTQADCGPSSYCRLEYYEPSGGPFCFCEQNPCTSDADCGVRACYFGECVTAGCMTNVDCPSGQCGVWSEYWGGSDNYGWDYGLTCRTGEMVCE